MKIFVTRSYPAGLIKITDDQKQEFDINNLKTSDFILVFRDGSITMRIFKQIYMKGMDVYFKVLNMEYFLQKIKNYNDVEIIHIDSSCKRWNCFTEDSFDNRENLFYNKKKCRSKSLGSVCSKKDDQTKVSAHKRRILSIPSSNTSSSPSKEDNRTKMSFAEQIFNLDNKDNLREFRIQNYKNYEINLTKKLGLENNRVGEKAIELSFQPDIIRSIKTSIAYPAEYLSEPLSCHIIFEMLSAGDKNIEDIYKNLSLERDDIENTLKSLVYSGIIKNNKGIFSISNYMK